MKKILFVATEFAPGMIPYASSIINTLSKSKEIELHAIVVNSKNRSYRKNIIPSPNIRFIEYPQTIFLKLIYKLYPFKIIHHIKKTAKLHKIDTIHLLTGDFSLFLYVLFKIKKKNLYYTVHDIHPHEQDYEKKSFRKKLFHRYIVWGNKINRIIINNLTTSSYSQLNELKAIYPKKRILFTPFPTLITPSISNGDRIVEELHAENNYILFFGFVDKYKGTDLLIESYNASPILQRYKLVIAGKGVEYNYNNRNIIRINRYIPDEELANLFSKALVVVYPYRSITMSGVLSLAYYFNKRVVVSNVPYFTAFANPNTSFFSNGNTSDLQAKLEFICSEKMPGIPVYENFYSDKQLIEAYINLYS